MGLNNERPQIALENRTTATFHNTNWEGGKSSARSGTVPQPDWQGPRTLLRL